ncbi:MAG TPA: AtpZ/AtpI family protein [Nodosilinea sp.]|nr:AtpZ/AtpI family protein [Nodosilinea sp.]
MASSIKYSTSEPDPSTLSVKAQNSNLSTFLGRIALSVLAAPLGGYLLGLLIERRWPGEISWALSLFLFGLVVGVIYLWLWMKQPGANRLRDDADLGKQNLL